MRIQVKGDCGSASTLRAYLSHENLKGHFSVSNILPAYTITIEEHELPVILFDSVDSKLEANALAFIRELTLTPVQIDTHGGEVHSEDEIRICVPARNGNALQAVERGLLRALLKVTNHGKRKSILRLGLFMLMLCIATHAQGPRPTNNTVVPVQPDGTKNHVTVDACTGCGGGGSSDVTIHDPSATSQKLAVDVNGRIGINNFPATQPISAISLPLPSGASTLTAQTTGNSSLSSIDGKLVLPGALDGSGFLKTHEQGTASVSGTVTANAGSNLNTSALALESGGNLATVASTVRAEDSASADADKGIGALAIRKATPANTSGTDGDYEYLQMSAGRLWTSAVIDSALPAGTNLIGHTINDSGSTTVVTGSVAVTNSGLSNLDVLLSTRTKPSDQQHALLDSNTGVDIGKLTANQSVNVSQMNGVAISMGTGIMGTGVQRVAIASDNDALTVKQGTAANLNATVVQVTGTNLHMVCDSGCSAAGSFADSAAFTAGATTISNIGGVYNESIGTVTSGRGAAARITVNRALHTNIRTSGGTELLVDKVSTGTLNALFSQVVVNEDLGGYDKFFLYFTNNASFLGTVFIGCTFHDASGNSGLSVTCPFWSAKLSSSGFSAFTASTSMSLVNPVNGDAYLIVVPHGTSSLFALVNPYTSGSIDIVMRGSSGIEHLDWNSTGQAAPLTALQVGGNDGTNLRALLTSSTGQLHSILDSGSTTAVTGNVAGTIADGADVALGAKADAKSTATDTTAVTLMQVMKEISFMEQNPASQAVTNEGTFPVQATLAAETTKVIGTVRMLGNVGGIFDTTQNAAVAANSVLGGCNFTSSPASITTGNQGAVQCNVKGELLTQLTDGTTGVSVIAGTNALKTDLSSVAGTATSTAASGVQLVGIEGRAGTSLETTAGVLDENVKNIGNSAVSTAAAGVQKVGIVGNAGANVDQVAGSAVPANVVMAGTYEAANSGRILQCDKSVKADISSATTTSLVAVSGSTSVYVCSYAIEIQGVATTAGTILLETGTGAACTSPAVVTPAYIGSTTAGTPTVITSGSNLGYLFKGAASSGLCALTTTSTVQKVFISYAQF